MSAGAGRSGPSRGRGRVCMLVKNSFEYDARVRKEAESLVRAGHGVTVVAIHVPGATVRQERTDGGVDVVRVPRLYGRLSGLAGPSTVAPGAGGGRRGLRRPRFLDQLLGAPLRLANAIVLNRRFAKAAVAARAVVLHAHDLNTLAAGVAAKRRTGARLVYDAHELHTERSGMGGLRRRWARFAEGRGLRLVDAMITATDAWAEYLAELYELEGKARPSVVRNLPELLEPEPGWDLRKELGIAQSQRVLLYQGSIQANRGLEQVIAALDRLPDCTLVVIGYGTHRPALEREVRRRGLRDRVRFFGPIPNDELLHYTASADVGLCCIVGSSLSYAWSLPNKLFEYMMAGIPQVASDLPEMGRVVRAHDVGEVCNPLDPDSIASGVRRILDDPGRAERCRRNARTAIAQLNWGEEEERLLAVYDRLTL